jgi:formate dehydrogenase subunit beta
MKVGDLLLGVSQDREIAERSENGGVVTSLLKFLLKEGLVDGVFAVKAGENRYGGVPSYVTDPEEVVECAGTLHFATPSIAKNVKKYLDTHENRIAVVCKSCDARAIIELAKINQINIDNVLMIGVNCSGTLSPVPHIQMLRGLGIDPYSLQWEDMDGKSLLLRFEDGHEQSFNLDELEERGLGRRANCQRCDYPVPRMADLACGKWGLEESDRNSTFIEVCTEKGRDLLERASARKLIKLSSPTEKQVGRREREEREKVESAREKQAEDFSEPTDESFWLSQFENCIKCYGCRDVCPLCHCKRCVLERDVPETVTKGVIPPPLTFGMIRVLHVACYCINCGQCEDVCSADIPLSRLTHNLNRASSELFSYTAGVDIKAPLPLCAIPEEEKRLESPELQYR